MSSREQISRLGRDLKSYWAWICAGQRISSRAAMAVTFAAYLAFEPALQAVILYRVAKILRALRVPVLPHLVNYFVKVLFNLTVTLKADIGGGLVISHTSGIVIGDCKIGVNAKISPCVTIGARYFDVARITSRPSIGDDVTIGAGARILGPVVVGDRSIIGANAVVLTSIPADTVAAGVPAKIVSTRSQDVP